MLQAGLRIHFAHRTFRWDNNAPGEASVFCVIIGWGLTEPRERLLFDYQTPKSQPMLRRVNKINPYLVDFDDVFVTARHKSLSLAPKITFGSMPNEAQPKRKDIQGQFPSAEVEERLKDQLLLTTPERNALIQSEPAAAKWIRRIYGSKEFLNGIERWCLWMEGITPSELRVCRRS